jgi:hypothetical protein
LPGLVEAFGLILVWLTRKLQENYKKTTRKRLLPLGFNDLLMYQKIEPGAGSVVESVGQEI